MSTAYHDPKITVLMSVYNSEKYLKEAIESILNQTFADFEFLIMDDHSNDDSVRIINNYHDERIKFIRNEVRLGLASSLNKGIRLARGVYIARMDADDISLSTRLERQNDFFDNHKDIGVIGAQAELIDANGKTLGKTQKFTTHALIKWTNLFSSSMLHPTIFARKELLEKNLYNENFSNSQDYELWSRLLKKTRFENIDECLLRLRIHGRSTSQTLSIPQKEKALSISFHNIKEHITLSPDDERALRHIRLVTAVSLRDLCVAGNIYRRLFEAYQNQEQLSTKDKRKIQCHLKSLRWSSVKYYLKSKFIFHR